MRAILIALAVMVSGAAWGDAAPSFWGRMTGPVYRGPHAAPDLSSKEAFNYRTRLRQAAPLPANFASSYRLVTWGCGATCETGAVINLRTGRVVFLPVAICCTASEEPIDSIEFRQDSSLIVFTGLQNSEQPDGRHFYNFDGTGFTFLETRPLSEPPPSVTAPSAPVPVIEAAPSVSAAVPPKADMPATPDDKLKSAIKRFGFCARPKIQYGQFSSFDGGKSAMDLMYKCASEGGDFLDACKAGKPGGTDPDNSCSLALATVTQLMLKEMGK